MSDPLSAAARVLKSGGPLGPFVDALDEETAGALAVAIQQRGKHQRYMTGRAELERLLAADETLAALYRDDVVVNGALRSILSGLPTERTLCILVAVLAEDRRRSIDESLRRMHTSPFPARPSA